MREHRCFASRSHWPDNGKGPLPKQGAFTGGWTRHRSVDLSIFSRTLYQLSYPAVATLTGLEPATSAVTGRHANQLRYRAILNCCGVVQYYLLAHSRSDPNGIRTRAAAVKGRCPRPLNDRAASVLRATDGQAYGCPAGFTNRGPCDQDPRRVALVGRGCRASLTVGLQAPIRAVDDRMRASSSVPYPSCEGVCGCDTCCYCCAC